MDGYSNVAEEDHSASTCPSFTLPVDHLAVSLSSEDNHNIAEEDSTSPLLPSVEEPPSASQLEEESSDLSEVIVENHPSSASLLSPSKEEHPFATLSLQDTGTI